MTSLYSFLRDTLIVLGFTALLWALLPAPPPYFEDKSYKCHYLEEHANTTTISTTPTSATPASTTTGTTSTVRALASLPCG